MVHSNIKIQQEFRSFASLEGWRNPHAVTLTMKQGQQLDAGRGPAFVALNPDMASTNLTHFLNRLNKAIYGNAAQRYGKRVASIPVLEGGNGQRLHYHLMLDCPRPDLEEGYPDLIDRLWQKTEWGYKINDVTPKSDHGWTKYISKLRDKANFSDSFDWPNYHPSTAE